MGVAQPDKSAIEDERKVLAKLHRQIREMDEELARDGIAIRPNERGVTSLWVFDTKAGRWKSPPDDFDADKWRKNWRKLRLGTPKVQPPPRLDDRLGLPDFTSESPAPPADNQPQKG